MMNAGYAVWREAVADIMADSILSEYTSLTLADVRDEVSWAGGPGIVRRPQDGF